MKGKIIALMLGIFIFIALANAEETNITAEQRAKICFEESKIIFSEMQNRNFSFLRVNDSLKQLESLYNAQMILKEKKKSYDFSVVLPYCDDIKKIKEIAFNSRDETEALKKFYRESFEGIETDTESIEKIIAEIEKEIANERYELIDDLINKAYKEIVNAKSQLTTLNLFYETTSASIGKFIDRNKYFILGSVILLALGFAVYKNTINKWILKNKIKNLELRKKTLKEIIMKTQKEYFEKGEISEGTFNIKIKKLAELIRDIDRQIPMLQESLMKLEWNSYKITKKEK